MDQRKVADLNLDRLFIRTSDGIQLPVSEVATIDQVNGPLQINRDATKRRVVIGVNVRDADIQQVVASIRESLERNVSLKPGYYFEYGGQFENLQNAIRTLLVVIPVALLLILLLLFFAFKSATYTLVVFSTVPLSIIGGILALWLRGLPFSISAGVGFIALFGVAVLNGILMINQFNSLRDMSTYPLSTRRIIARGTQHLLRPVFLTGLVASLGFVPMAIATTAGAEVQRPLATVVIGGLFVSTLLTLFVVPVFYKLVGEASLLRRRPLFRRLFPLLLLPMLLLQPLQGHSQERVTLDEAVEMAVANHPRLQSADVAIERTRAMRGESWELAPTTVDYSFGQLNGTERNDREISITQSVGSLLTPPLLQECAGPPADRNRWSLQGAGSPRGCGRGQTGVVLLPLYAGAVPALCRPEYAGHGAFAHEPAVLRTGRHHAPGAEHNGDDGLRDAQQTLPGRGGAQGGCGTPAVGLLLGSSACSGRQHADAVCADARDLGRTSA